MEKELTDRYLGRKIRRLKKSAILNRRDFRPGRRRFGLYRFLADVYEVYRDLRSRRIARKASRKIAKILELPIRKKTHPIRLLIEAAGGVEDSRQKSRWTQALKFAFGWRQPADKLDWFFGQNGGVSGCARKYSGAHGTTRCKKMTTNAGSGELSELGVKLG
jgi:hypothetical protein